MKRFALVLLTGCGTGTVAIDARLADASLLMSKSTTLDLADGTLVIETARIAASEIELEASESKEFEAGPAVIEISLDGSSTEIAASDVPTGRYGEFGFEMMLADGDDFASFDGGDPASILVSGTYKDARFTFRSQLAVEVEFKLDPPAEVSGANDARVEISFDVASWFTASDGTVLDPTDGANASAIDANILASMEAIGDVEYDGDDGDDGDGEGDDD